MARRGRYIVEATPQPRLGVPTSPTFSSRLPRRPNELPTEVLVRFLAALRAGNFRGPAAQLAGLSPGTVEQWLKRGRGQLVRQGREPTVPYVRFARLVAEAEAAAEAMVTSNLVQLSRTNARAAEVWLRTRHPERWPQVPVALPEEVEPTEPPVPNQTLVVLKPHQIPEVVHKLLEDRRRELRGPEPEDRLPITAFYVDSEREES
jgi:hypothetical protein